MKIYRIQDWAKCTYNVRRTWIPSSLCCNYWIIHLWGRVTNKNKWNEGLPFTFTHLRDVYRKGFFLQGHFRLCVIFPKSSKLFMSSILNHKWAQWQYYKHRKRLITPNKGTEVYLSCYNNGYSGYNNEFPILKNAALVWKFSQFHKRHYNKQQIEYAGSAIIYQYHNSVASRDANFYQNVKNYSIDSTTKDLRLTTICYQHQ